MSNIDDAIEALGDHDVVSIANEALSAAESAESCEQPTDVVANLDDVIEAATRLIAACRAAKKAISK